MTTIRRGFFVLIIHPRDGVPFTLVRAESGRTFQKDSAFYEPHKKIKFQNFDAPSQKVHLKKRSSCLSGWNDDDDIRRRRRRGLPFCVSFLLHLSLQILHEAAEDLLLVNPHPPTLVEGGCQDIGCRRERIRIWRLRGGRMRAWPLEEIPCFLALSRGVSKAFFTFILFVTFYNKQN